MSEPKPVSINELPVEHLQKIAKQLEQEIEFLVESYQTLQHAANRFNESREVLDDFKPSNKDHEIMIPLTSSLYMPGQLTNPNKVLVDVGTGYYVEKSVDSAKEYTERRTKELKEKAREIDEQVESKRSSMVQVQMVLQAKLAQLAQLQK